MSITRTVDNAEGLAAAFAACLKPGPHGDPIIEEHFGASFVVRGSESGRRYRVTCTEIEPGDPIPIRTSG